ncbi:uncharacterized protein TNCV_952761 [Trichonephila clavipes]|nr:uncharacterized protein TNCV_952761 [Trichonephila clavipes]
MDNNICNSMILTSRRRHFYLVGQSKHKVGACGVNNQASAVLAGNELPFVAFSPDGHGYEHVSSVRALVPQRFSVEEELMHVKHVEVKCPHVGVMWKFGRGIISSGGRYPLRGLRFASARCLEIVCGTIATPTSARIVERVTVGSTSACRLILRSSLFVVFLVAPDPFLSPWAFSRVHCSQQFLTAHSERSTWLATRCVEQPAFFILKIRLLSNSLNCEKCLLARLPGMFRLPKSSYNRRVIVMFMNLRICAVLYSTLFLIVEPPLRV